MVSPNKLKYSEDCKLLGVIFEHNSTFSNFENIKTNSNQSIQKFLNLCYSKFSPSLHTKKSIFYALIRSNLEYCPAALMYLKQHEKNKLETIQRKCLRGILKVSLKDRLHNTCVHKKLNAPELEKRWQELLINWREKGKSNTYLDNEISKRTHI